MLKTQSINQHAGFTSLLSQGSRSSKRNRKQNHHQKEADKAKLDCEEDSQDYTESLFKKDHGQVKESEAVVVSKNGNESMSNREEERLSMLLDATIAEFDKESMSENDDEINDEQDMTSQPRRRPLAKLTPAQESSGQHNKAGMTNRGHHLSSNSDQQDQQQVLNNSEAEKVTQESSSETVDREKEFKAELVWRNIILFVILHSCLPIATYMLINGQVKVLTILFSIFLLYATGIGITGGTHRLWSHKAYKAKWPVQVLLMFLQTMAGQNSIYTWSRDHRVHHKFSETNADPHNIKRGFLFAHMGWLCCRKHPDVKEKGKVIDMSDLEANPVVMFQHRNFWWLAAAGVVVPTMIPVLMWNENYWVSFTFVFMLRYLISLHETWLVNSAAHSHGNRPYDVNMEARESPFVIYNALGEGFHNFHHTFPYDYATSEHGRAWNITTAFIDLCAAIGLASDRRKVDQETILKRRLRTGNLSEEELSELEQQCSNANKNGQKTAANCRSIQKTIDEDDESTLAATAPLVARHANGLPLSNIIQELPYISGLMSMKYTM